MSQVTNQINEENFVANDYNLAKIFVWGNRYSKGTFLNNTGALASFPRGTVLARKSDTNQLVPLDVSTSTLGQDIPVGILNQDLNDIAIAGTVADVSFCNEGDAVEGLLTLNGGDDFNDAVTGGRTIRDLLKAVGIRLVDSQDLTGTDNV